MDTLTKVRAIFFSGAYAFRGDLESIHEIVFLLDEGYLKLTTEPIAPKKAYSETLDAVLKNPHAYNIAAGGGNNHVALKLLAAAYLKTRCRIAVRYEHLFCGHYPDVLTEDETVVVECGHTQNPEKMLTYFRQGGIKKCIQIPYPTEEDSEVRGYVFSGGNGLAGFLDALERKKLDELRGHYGK
ncbi:MAG: hypothetical protein Q8P78_01090 [bacterium]|nr:hypothetical protein [bacterium]